MPTTLARSITLNGIARPRSFSATAQKMWPPSSGRNGKRLTMASDNEIAPRRKSACAVENWKDWAGHLIGADHAGDLLAVVGV